MNSVANNIGTWLRYWADRGPERTALTEGDRVLAWSQLEARTQQIVAALRARGVGAGDRVALLLDNRSAYFEVIFGLARLGASCLPMNTRLAPREIAFLLDDARPVGLIYESELAETVESACDFASRTPEIRVSVGGERDEYESMLSAASPDRRIEAVSPEHPLILMYTSGTTGQPKGALLPHRKALFNCLNAQLAFGIRRDDRALVASPLFHSLALQIISLPVLYAGGSLILHRRFDPHEVWETVDREQISFFGSVPTVHQRLADVLEASEPGSYSLNSLRFCFTAGAAAPVELVHTFARHGLVLAQGYGQTETSMLCCLEPEDALRKAGSVGRPLHHLELRIIEVEGIEGPVSEWRDVSPGEMGEIVVRGPVNMLGYWERPEANAETLRTDGWLRTNDLATRDAEGFVTLSGRARDMYISGGENVYPAEVEAVLREHPSIREVAVVGVPHTRWGETGRAHIVLNRGAELDNDSLLSWAADRLARFKLPTSFCTESELPKTATGKVQKHRLGGRG